MLLQLAVGSEIHVVQEHQELAGARVRRRKPDAKAYALKLGNCEGFSVQELRLSQIPLRILDRLLAALLQLVRDLARDVIDLMSRRTSLFAKL